MIGIYKIENTLNGKVYIGSSKDINLRWQGHLSKLKHNKHSSQHLQYSFNKYGKECFEFSIILECPLDKLFFFEDIYIRNHQSMNRNYGYNLTNVNPNNGAVLNDSLETKEKLRRIVYKRNYGDTTEEEYQQWKEEVQKEKNRVKGLLHTNAKSIFQINKLTGEVINRFESVSSAARELNTKNVEILRRAVTGKIKTHKGFVFIYESLYTPTYDYRILPKVKIVSPPVPRVPFKGNSIMTYNVKTKELKEHKSVKELTEILGTKTKYIYRVLGRESRTYKDLRIKYVKNVESIILDSGIVVVDI